MSDERGREQPCRLQVKMDGLIAYSVGGSGGRESASDEAVGKREGEGEGEEWERTGGRRIGQRRGVERVKGEERERGREDSPLLFADECREMALVAAAVSRGPASS